LSAVTLRTKLTALVAAIALLLIAGIWFALTHASAQSTDAGKAGKDRSGSHAAKAPSGPMLVTSISPSSRTTGVNGTAAIDVSFSAPVAPGSPLPTVNPSVAGTWEGQGTTTLKFVPAWGFKQHTRVTVTIPGGANGVRSTGGGLLASTTSLHYRTGGYSVTRLDQLLAQLDYLPLTWSAAPGATVPAAGDHAGQLAAAYSPPAGQFTWDTGYPATLRTFWHGGQPSGLILKGAVMAFEADHGMSLDGIAGPHVWSALLTAVAHGQVDKHGYTYAIADESNPETLTIWHNGHQVLRTLANTGIPQSPTVIGTAPVYLRYYTQIMRGRNPDGTKYADRVYWVSYFRNGEAVHYYDRGSYGFPQSLGCVELPWNEAETAWPYLTYGSLVTVLPGSQTPSTSPVDPTT
jgi:hypothetical protein